MNKEWEKKQQTIVNRILKARNSSGFWKTLQPGDANYPEYTHYVPCFRASLWALIELADLQFKDEKNQVKPVLKELIHHFFKGDKGMYTMGGSHSPFPCLNGNMIYLDAWFNGSPGKESSKALDFFAENQRFDDGEYLGKKNRWCDNKHCYSKHSCYWGVVKLMKGISFISPSERTEEVQGLIDRCIDFVLLHRVCFSSRKPEKLMIRKIDALTFPNMYTSELLEILWILKREKVESEALIPALNLLKSKRNKEGTWNLERKISNLVSTVGEGGAPNPFISSRAEEVMDFYGFL